MASILIQQSVKDYSEWKKVFDSLSSLRASKGALSDQVFQDASDMNKVTVLVQYNSVESAKAWAESPELRAAQEKAGILGRPNVSILQEVGR